MGKVMLVLVMVLGIAAGANAAIDWAHTDGVAYDFGTGTNWVGGVVPARNVTAATGVASEPGLGAGGNYAVLAAGEVWEVRNVIGPGWNGSTAQLDVLGELQINDWLIGIGWESNAGGILNVGGTVRFTNGNNGRLSIGVNGSGEVNILDGGLIEVGSGQGGVLMGSDDLLTIAGSGMLVIRNIDMTGDIDNWISLGNITGTGVYSEYVGGNTVVQTPEPATLSLLGLGGLALIRRKRS